MPSHGAAPTPAASHHCTGQGLLLWQQFLPNSGRERGGGGGGRAPQSPTELWKRRGGKGCPGQAATPPGGLPVRPAPRCLPSGRSRRRNKRGEGRNPPSTGRPRPSPAWPTGASAYLHIPPLRPTAALRMRGRPLARARFQPLRRVGRSAR